MAINRLAGLAVHIYFTSRISSIFKFSIYFPIRVELLAPLLSPINDPVKYDGTIIIKIIIIMIIIMQWALVKLGVRF